MNIIDFWNFLELFFNDLHPNFCDDYVTETDDGGFINIVKEFYEQINPSPEV